MKYLNFVETNNKINLIFNPPFVYNINAIANNIRARCKIIQGEYSYNISLGIPLKGKQDVIDLNIKDIILNTKGVSSIRSFTSSFNSSNYTASIIIVTERDEVLSLVI